MLLHLTPWELLCHSSIIFSHTQLSLVPRLRSRREPGYEATLNCTIVNHNVLRILCNVWAIPTYRVLSTDSVFRRANWIHSLLLPRAHMDILEDIML